VKSRELKDLVGYRLQRGRDTLEEARLMAKEGHWNACANRLYYAAFYMVSALLIQNGLASAKHSGVQGLFNRHFVKTGKVAKEHGRLYNTLFDLRQEGDYVDFVLLGEETVAPLIQQVEHFEQALGRLIEDAPK